MEEFIESVQGPTPPKQKDRMTQSQSVTVEDDGFDNLALKVPRSVLDSCQESFTAADEARTKSSIKFFDCTGLMALVCHHDCVLWLANMTSAGEKQVYPLVLLEMLFQHLPQWEHYTTSCVFSSKHVIFGVFLTGTLTGYSLQYQYFMHLAMGGHVRSYTTHRKVLDLDTQMENVASGYGD